MLSDCGWTTAPSAVSPCSDSSWMMAGMPKRVSSRSQRWMSLPMRVAPTGSSSVEPEMRVTWPMPAGPAAWARTASNVTPSESSAGQTEPSWAIFSARVIRASRSATRSSTGKEAS